MIKFGNTNDADGELRMDWMDDGVAMRRWYMYSDFQSGGNNAINVARKWSSERSSRGLILVNLHDGRIIAKCGDCLRLIVNHYAELEAKRCKSTESQSGSESTEQSAIGTQHAG